MAVKRKARGKAERRTAPARGTKARGATKARDIAKLRLERSRRAAKAAAKFAPADRVFHLVDPSAFVVTTDKKTGIEHRGPAKDAVTTCCAKPVAKVWGIALSRASFTEPVDNWCAGVPQ